MIKPFYLEDSTSIEMGIDEVGRGPMFGRVYAGAVVLPKTGFDYSLMKDSKKFSSKKKLDAAAKYIKENALYWSTGWEDEKTIDKINIRQASFQAMHKSITTILNQMEAAKFSKKEDVFLLVDGNAFKPYTIFKNDTLFAYKHECVIGGDNEYASIAAASILAKVERDRYIIDLCDKYPILSERYALDGNKGYGAKRHMDGIREHGITQWHRKTFGICKNSKINIIE